MAAAPPTRPPSSTRLNGVRDADVASARGSRRGRRDVHGARATVLRDGNCTREMWRERRVAWQRWWRRGRDDLATRIGGRHAREKKRTA